MKPKGVFRSCAAVLPIFALLIVAPGAEAQRRELSVRQPPESVFAIPADEVLPRLRGASPTGENGRVGGELVFWGYRLADGSDAYLFACALRIDVDCDARIDAICPTRTTVLERRARSGEIVHRRCEDIAIAAPGELRPGCTSTAMQADLTVGLVTCG